MILEYTSVGLLLQSAASISRIFIYGKNTDGCVTINIVTESGSRVQTSC